MNVFMNPEINAQIPWVVGVFETSVDNPEEFIFMRTGVLISPYLVLVAGLLNFTRPFSEYQITGGISSIFNIKKQEIDNWSKTVTKSVSYIRYEDDFKDAQHFSMALIHLNSEWSVNFTLTEYFKNITSPISTLTYTLPFSSTGNPYVSGNYLASKTPTFSFKVGGFTSTNGFLTYFKGEHNKTHHLLFNYKGEIASENDPCILNGNMISIQMEYLNWVPNILVAGLARKGFEGQATFKEEEIIFDGEFCWEDIPRVVLVRSLGKHVNFFNEPQKCSTETFACDGKCLKLHVLCNGKNDCKYGVDENPVYCIHFSSNNDTDGEKELLIILASSLSIVFIIAIILAILGYQMAKRKYQKLNKGEVYEFFDGKKKNAVDENKAENFYHMPYNKKDEIKKKDLKIMEESKLGEGAFGEVFKGEIKDKEGISREVAVKMIKENADISYLRAILMEIKIFQYLGHHPNIIGFFGAITKGVAKGSVLITLEFAHLGSLLEFLKSENQRLNMIENSEENIANLFKDCAKWSQEIASGMAYFEEKRVIHGDLAARNILLTSDKTVKITDFGLSRKLYDYDLYSKQNKAPLPWRHMALESLQDLTFSSKSDVWAYAVTLWELFTLGQTPYAGMNWSTEFVHELENGLRLGKPKNMPEPIYELMKSCWDNEPKNRPGFIDILTTDIFKYNLE